MEKGKYFCCTNIGTMSIYQFIGKYGDWVMFRKAVVDELQGAYLEYAYVYIYNSGGMLVYEAELKLVNGALYTRVIYKQKGFTFNRMWRDVS